MIDKLPHGLFAEILKCGNRNISISRQLIQNCTTNSAETFTGINAKFNGGKQINRIQKGSFEGRCYGAGLCFQAGPSWHGKIWEKSTGIENSVIMKDYCHRVYRKRKAGRERQNSEPTKKRRRLSKVKKKRDDCHYGSNCQEPDIEPSELHKLCQETAESLRLTQEQCKKAEEETRTQRDSELWVRMRRKRCKQRRSTPCSRLVKDMLYSSTHDRKSVPLSFGIKHEKEAISKYESETGNKVLPSGLFICPEFSFLGASPDGIVEDISTGDRGLLEVKCFYSATQKGIKERKCTYTPQEAAVLLKDCPIKKSTTGHLMLGKNEGHHFQVQGAMQIAKAGWCDYVAWTPAGIFIERIRKDDNFWTEKMLPNLKWFFL